MNGDTLLRSMIRMGNMMLSVAVVLSTSTMAQSNISTTSSGIDAIVIADSGHIEATLAIELKRQPSDGLVPFTVGNGFHLTSQANGVLCALSATGTPQQTAWTTAGSDVAFLVLDRNGNGTIDDSTELFGMLTPQPLSSTPNGFAALAQFDKPENGGNGDGVIDKHDLIFSSLRLWRDLNHDCKSTSEELFTLPSLGVTSISLNYKQSMRSDVNGNLFRYRARVNSAERDQTGFWAYDVVFANRPN